MIFVNNYSDEEKTAAKKKSFLNEIVHFMVINASAHLNYFGTKVSHLFTFIQYHHSPELFERISNCSQVNVILNKQK